VASRVVLSPIELVLVSFHPLDPEDGATSRMMRILLRVVTFAVYAHIPTRSGSLRFAEPDRRQLLSSGR
jgi:hypothetical protein